MGDPKGFMKIRRKSAGYRPVCERLKDYKDVVAERNNDESMDQASRCMDCGVPFCHWACPIGNYIPEWNDLVFKDRWEQAFELLNATNNLPEMTGRLCPALCEYGCVLGINDDPVTIRENELDIIEHAFAAGFIKAVKPKVRTGKKIAVVGSGPAGLSCASQLNRAGHNIVVYEKDNKAGGLLRYGIPDFKLEKNIIDRRLGIMEEEGIEFKTSVNVGEDVSAEAILKEYDAVCLAGGSRVPRDLQIEGRELDGVYFAMDYLVQANRMVDGEKIPEGDLIDVKGKKVVVIGGGDTGSDCVGTANRQGASCVVQIELLDQPAECRTDEVPWPNFPVLLKTTSSHEEGADRQWSVLTKKFVGEGGKVQKIECVKVEFEKADLKACPVMKEIPGSEFDIEADIIVLAVGFIHPEQDGLIAQLGLETDERGNVKAGDDFAASADKVFAAGDMRRGQSLIVWAISEGRKAAYNMDKFLMGESGLPTE